MKMSLIRKCGIGLVLVMLAFCVSGSTSLTSVHHSLGNLLSHRDAIRNTDQVVVFELHAGAFITIIEQDLQPSRKFDEFGDTNCEDEMARLDNLAVTLQNDPAGKGLIIFYGGRQFRGRLPKRGEAAARAARIKPYLVESRGIPANRVIVIDGGYAEEWHAEVWVIPPGASMPTPQPTIPIEKIKFSKAKANQRDYKCQI
jgi:hypothetical protein